MKSSKLLALAVAIEATASLAMTGHPVGAFGDPFREITQASKRRLREDKSSDTDRALRREKRNAQQLEQEAWNERLNRRNVFKPVRNKVREASMMERGSYGAERNLLLLSDLDIQAIEVERAVDFLVLALDQKQISASDIGYIMYAPFFKTPAQDESFSVRAKELKWLT